MSSKLLMSALAAVATVVVVGAAQDPTFEFPAAHVAGYNVPKPDLEILGQSTGKISVTFRDATVREVLDWLARQIFPFRWSFHSPLRASISAPVCVFRTIAEIRTGPALASAMPTCSV